MISVCQLLNEDTRSLLKSTNKFFSDRAAKNEERLNTIFNPPKTAEGEPGHQPRFAATRAAVNLARYFGNRLGARLAGGRDTSGGAVVSPSVVSQSIVVGPSTQEKRNSGLTKGWGGSSLIQQPKGRTQILKDRQLHDPNKIQFSPIWRNIQNEQKKKIQKKLEEERDKKLQNLLWMQGFKLTQPTTQPNYSFVTSSS